MNPKQLGAVSAFQNPEGFENGYKVEHVMLSVMIVHRSNIIQYDDSCARIIEKALKEYKDVVRSQATVLYNHSKTDCHTQGCGCGICSPITAT